MKQRIINEELRKIALTIVMIVMKVVVSACAITPRGWSNHKYNINQEDKFSAEAFKSITVSTVGADIKVIVTNEKELRFHYYGDVTIASTRNSLGPYIDIDETGSSLVLAEKLRSGLNSISYKGRAKLDIYMPKKYEEQLKLNSASGDVYINNFGGYGDINTASGDINIENCRGDFDVNTASGNVTYRKDAALKSDLAINSVSGDIDISISKDSEFNFKLRTVSGKIKCDFPVTLEGRGAEGTVGGGKNDISLNTVSGNITIKNN